MAAWLIQVPLMSYLAGSLAQPPSRRANTEKASALRMVESFADEAGAAGGLHQAVRGCSRVGRLLEDQDRVHLDLRAAWQGGNADGGAGRVWLLEVLAHDLVDLGEVAQVGEEDVQLDDVLERTASRFGHGLQVFEDLYGLGFEAVHQFHGFRVEGNLAGHVDGVASLDRLGVGADGGWGFVAADNGLAHEQVPCNGRLRRRAIELCAHAGDADHPGQGAQFLDHAGQVHAVVHADHQLDHADATIAFVHADFLDIAVGGIDAAGQQGDQAALVLQLDAQLDIEFAGDILGPGELDAFFRVVADFADIAAVVQVHHHAFAGGQVTDNRVARDRCTALGVAEHQAFGTTDRQRTFGAGQLFAFAEQATGDHIGHAVAQADVFQQVFDQFQAVFVEHGLHALAGNLVQGAVETVEHLVQQAFAQADGFGAALQFQGVADMGARLAGDDKVEPRRIRARAGGADDLDRGAALQRFGQRRETAIDPTGNAAVADVGMYRVGKVHRRGAFRQLHDPALGREHIDLVREQVDLHAFDEFQGVAGALLHFQHALDPLAGPGMGALGLLVATGLVQPVGGDAVVGHLFHFAGANLDLDRYAVHAEQCGMQRLVAVGLGDRDVVLEAAGQRFVQIMYSAEDPIAGVDLVDDDPERVDVHDLVEGPALAAHLGVDAVQVLLPSADFTLDAVDGQAVAQGLFDLVDDFLAVAPGALDRLVDPRGTHRVHGLEAEVFEFDADRMHAQPVGDGGVDLKGFLGDAPAFFAGQHFKGAHVVQAVGELDRDHANIAGHGHGHLLEVFRLGFGLGLEIHLGQFADPVDQFGHGFTKLRLQRFLGDPGVFDHVMEHGRHQALMVHVHVGKNIGHRQRMRDVGFAAATALTVMGLFGVEVRPADQVDLVGAEVGR